MPNVGIISVWRVNLVRLSATLTVCTESHVIKKTLLIVSLLCRFICASLSLLVCLCQSFTHSEGLNGAFRGMCSTLKSTLLRTAVQDVCARRDVMVPSSAPRQKCKWHSCGHESRSVTVV